MCGNQQNDDTSRRGKVGVTFQQVRTFHSLISRKTDFCYVVQRQEKAKVCFGSGLERKTLEADKKGLVSKHARCNITEIFENVGPTTYDFAERKSAVSDLITKPTSKRGTILGGRTARRKTIFETEMMTPGPGAYNIPTTFDKVHKQSCAPFNSGLDRWKHKHPDVPGVGIYNVALHKRRRIAFAHTFGGKKCLFPAVKMKCGPFNFDTCERCQNFPEGDYWYLDIVEAENLSDAMKQKLSDTEGIFLCRPCYEIEKKENKIFSKGQIRVFKKIRDCSKVHFHDGCKAKLFLVSPQEIEKVKLREGYLSLYFS